jgi:hypothetical protein
MERNMKIIFGSCLGVIVSFFFTTAACAAEFGKVEIKDGWFYVNGEKFFVKGVNYEGYRPGESPVDGDKVNLEMVDRDFKLIKEAGFNTIRTAGALTPEIMELAKKHGLWVMHGIWFEKNMDYASPDTLTYARGLLKTEINWAKKFDNILCYLFLNEPDMERVRDAGKENTEEFLRNLYKEVKSYDPKRQVSFADWPPLAFVDHSFLDLAAFNVYIFSPNTISNSLGYRGYIEWLKKNVAKGKPLVITEFGLSVSQAKIGKSQPGFYSYGGNTDAQQAEGDIRMYDELIQGGAVGGCVFDWLDEWWMEGSKTVHDNLPEEYFGIVSLDESAQGKPRESYYALKQFNQAILIEPKRSVYYSDVLPIEVYTTDEIADLQFKIDDRAWQNLKKNGRFWWTENFDVSKISAGKHVFALKAFDRAGQALSSKSLEIIFGDKNKNKPEYEVKISTDKETYAMGDEVKLTVFVSDAQGNPAIDKETAYSLFQPVGWLEHGSVDKTNGEGKISKQFSPMAPGFMTVSAGVTYKDENGIVKRSGDVKVIRIK